MDDPIGRISLGDTVIEQKDEADERRGHRNTARADHTLHHN